MSLSVLLNINILTDSTFKIRFNFVFKLLKLKNTFVSYLNFMIKIKTGTIEDVNSLRDLCIETFYKKWKSTNTEEDMQCYMNEFFSNEKLKTELQDPEISYLISQSAEKFIAYTKIKRNSFEGDLGNLKPIEIQRMYVLESYIGQRIGESLMKEVIEIAKKEQFEVVWLGVWEKNYEAIKFYKRFGFDFYGSHDFVLGADITTDLLMKKVL